MTIPGFGDCAPTAFSSSGEQQWDNYNSNVPSTRRVERVSLPPSDPSGWCPDNDRRQPEPSHDASLSPKHYDLSSIEPASDVTVKSQFTGFDARTPRNDSLPAELPPTTAREQQLQQTAELREFRSQPNRFRIKAGLEPRHACSVNGCGKYFSSSTLLKRHLLTHSGERRFACSVCDKKFARNDALKVHTKIHTGEKPFTCYFCDKRFSRSSDFKKHTRIHTGEKPFACSVCDKRFTQNGHLKEHTGIHMGEKPFACSVCDKRFTRSDVFKNHTRIHTGDKRFACLACDKRFMHKHHLKEHERTHTGEKERQLFGIKNQTLQNNSLPTTRPASMEISEQRQLPTEAPSVPVDNPTHMPSNIPSALTPTLPQNWISHVPILSAVPPFEVKNPSLKNGRVNVKEPSPTPEENPLKFSIPWGAVRAGNRLLVKHEIDGSVEEGKRLKAVDGKRRYVRDVDGCGKHFSRKRNLTNYRERHVKEKQFACPVDGCGKGFYRNAHLQIHLKTHQGVKPFRCEWESCGKKFTRKHQFQKHVKTQHDGWAILECQGATGTDKV